MVTLNQNDRTLSRFLNARLHRVAAQDNDPYSTTLVADYCDLVDKVIDKNGYGHSLFRISPEELRTSKADIFIFKEADELCAALHMASDPDRKFTWINGVVKADGQSGALIRELMAVSMLAHDSISMVKVPYRACYRQFHQGFRDQFGKLRIQNKGSAKLFSDFAFKPIGVEKVEVKGSFQDRHLFEYCDPHTASFRVNKVQSSGRTIHMARDYMRFISQTIGRS